MTGGGPLRVVPFPGAGVIAGRFNSSTVSSVSLGWRHTGADRPRIRTAPQCLGCKGRGFVECQLCKGESASDWAPLCDPMVARRRLFPTRDSIKIQRHLNYWGRRGMAVRNAAEATEAPVLQATKENGSRKPVIPKFLIGKTYLDMEKIVYSFGGGATMQQKYRAKQMHQLIYKNKVKTIQECAQLPKPLRDGMESAGWSIGRSPIHHIVPSKDGAIKMLLKLEDNRLVETVGIPVIDKQGASRLTACVSSQVGCALKCAFCATGKGGFGRNLKSHEIVDQVLAIEDLFRQSVTNIVFMGMGEPLMNLGAVLDAHRTLNKELKIAQRMMTISTVGVPNTIRRLAAHELHSTLVVSLHAPNQELRSKLVPSAKSYPLDALMKDCKFYFETSGRRLSLEYTLLAGMNDQEEHAEELANMLHHWNFSQVNIIPYNPIADSKFERPTKAKVLLFVDTLAKWRITSSVKTTRGLDANAACGQLRNEFQKFPIQSPIAVER